MGRPLKASPFHAAPKTPQGPEGRQVHGWIGPESVRSPWDTTGGCVYLRSAEVVIRDRLQKETGWVSAFPNSKIGVLYSRTGLGSYFSFFAFILG